MDPATILQLSGLASSVAKGAWDVGEGLYLFVQDIRHQDATASAFAAEVKALSTACQMVGERLVTIVQQHESQLASRSSGPSKTPSRLWICLRDQISECDKTIKQLQEAYSCLKLDSGGRGPSVATRFIRQIKLHMKTKDIAESRNCIRSHTGALQLILQTIAIEISYVVPQRANQQLRTELAVLATKKQELEDLRAQRDAENARVARAQEDAVLHATDTVMSSGETLYAASVAGGSIVGDFSASKQQSIFQWIEAANAIDRLAFEVSDVETDTLAASSATESLTPTEDTRPSTPPPDTDETAGADDDLDSDSWFTLEAAQSAITHGRELFESGDYHDASLLLGEGLTMVRELSTPRQATVCDACELRYMLGICAFHLEEPSAAEMALLTIIESTPKAKVQDDKRRLQVCHAGHLLAMTYIRLSKLEKARMYCGNAVEGRRRVLGKDDDCFFDSLALMARISELEGNVARKMIMTRMIPKSKQDDLTKRYAKVDMGKPVVEPTTAPLQAAAPAKKPSIERRVQQCQDELERVIQARKLANFYPPGCDAVEQVAQQAPAKIDALIKAWKIEEKNAIGFVRLALYDVVFYFDDSGSMLFEENGARMAQFKAALQRLAFATFLFNDVPIPIRFMNQNNTEATAANQEQLDAIVLNMKLSGLSPFGSSLQSKVINGIFRPRVTSYRPLRKPLLVIGFTDGEPAGEDKDMLQKTISYAISLAEKQKYGRGAIAFNFIQVGNSERATEFLTQLENDAEVGQYVTCTTSQLHRGLEKSSTGEAGKVRDEESLSRRRERAESSTRTTRMLRVTPDS